MKHEDYLKRLIEGFAREPGLSVPEHSGSNEVDSACRWMCLHVANYVLEHGDFQVSPQGRMFFSGVRNVTSYLRNSGTEDINIGITGFRGNTLGEIDLHVVMSRQGTRDYFLRIADETNGRNLDATGNRSETSSGRILINDRGNPMLWHTQRQRESVRNRRMYSDVESMPQCCQRSLNSIARITGSSDALTEILAAAPGVVAAGRSPRITLVGVLFKIGKAAQGHQSLRDRMRQLTEAISRSRIRDVITHELAEHSAGELNTFWNNLLRGYR